MITSFTGPYRFLSNFSPSRIHYGGIDYPTVEHFFQAMKSKRARERRDIAECATATDAKRAGRRLTLRPDWEARKLGFMRAGLRKFAPRSELAIQLLATGDELLIEGNTWGDDFWGMVRDDLVEWTGENWLGHLLMARRAELRGQF